MMISEESLCNGTITMKSKVIPKVRPSTENWRNKYEN